MNRPVFFLGAGLVTALWSGSATAAEPDEVGPFEVRAEQYDLGDQVFVPLTMSQQVELQAEVYSPDDLSSGPFPFVLIMHGRHTTCYDPANPGGFPNDGSSFGGFSEWPCTQGRVPIPSSAGYQFLGERLASHGMIVVSVSANGINVFDNVIDDFGMLARADLISEHLALWSEWNQGGAGPLGQRFSGAVDFDRMGMLGHSRGGEGVAKWVSLDQADGEPNFVDAALLIAPTDFERLVLRDVPLAAVLPYCDGDVFDLSGAHYIDDARAAGPIDETPKYGFLLDGSNHNFYNTIWSPGEFVGGASDDFVNLETFLEPETDGHCGASSTVRLSESEQRDTLLAYTLAFLRVHLLDEVEFEEFLNGDAVPVSAASATPGVSYFAPSTPEQRLDINPLDDLDALVTNAVGGNVIPGEVTSYGLCGVAPAGQNVVNCVDNLGSFQGQPFDGRQPHTEGLGQLRIELTAQSRWSNFLAPGTDVSELRVLSFRAAFDFESALALTAPALVVELADQSGGSATVLVSDWNDPLEPPPGELFPVLPKKALRSFRIPLAAFEGVDLADLAEVTLALEEGSAALLLSDLSFSDPLPEPPSGTGSTGGSTGEPSSTDSSTTGPSTTSGEPMGSNSSGSAEVGTGEPGTTTGEPEDTDTDGAAADGDDGGCGCTTTHPTMPGALIMLCVFGFWRRRAATSSP